MMIAHNNDTGLTMFTSEAFAELAKRFDSAAELLPPGKIRSNLHLRAKEVRPWVRIAKKHPDATQRVLSQLSPINYRYIRSPIESLIDLPIRAQRILRGMITTISTGQQTLRTPPVMILTTLAREGHLSRGELAKLTPSYLGADKVLCQSDFDVAFSVLQMTGIIDYVQIADFKPFEWSITSSDLAMRLCNTLGITPKIVIRPALQEAA